MIVQDKWEMIYLYYALKPFLSLSLSLKNHVHYLWYIVNLKIMPRFVCVWKFGLKSCTKFGH